jgi:hypothetical protein
MKTLEQIMTAAQIEEGRRRVAAWADQQHSLETTLAATGSGAE